MGRKKSEFFKNGVKPLLWTLLGTHSSNFIFGPILGPILGHFWAQTDKNWPTNQNGSFSTIFCVEIKGQLISKKNSQAEASPKKQTNKFVFTSMPRSFVSFLGESLARKKSFRDYLTFKEIAYNFLHFIFLNGNH